MAKPRALQKERPKQSALLEALKFVSTAQHEEGSTSQTHCVLHNRWAVAFDGNIAIGTPIEEEVSICPHTYSFVAALKHCGQSFALVQLEARKVKIIGDKFSAFVSCLAPSDFPIVEPDPNIAPLTDDFKKALNAVSYLADEKSTLTLTASVLVQNGSVVATDRFVILEYWHGQDLPRMTLPKATAAVLCRTQKTLVGFGYSGRSATFHFEDGSWLRTQLFDWQYPDVGRILDQKSNAWPLPAGFFDGVRAVAPFNSQGTVIFGANILRSHDQEQVGATYEVQGIPKGIRYGAKNLLAAEPYMKTVDFVGQNEKGFFFNGENGIGSVRGCILQLAKTPEERMREREAYLATPEGQAADAERKRIELQEYEVRKAAWQARQDAKPWYPGKNEETYPDFDEEIPF